MMLKNKDKQIIERASKITLTDYEMVEVPRNDTFIDVDNLINVIEDLLIEYDRLKEEFEDYKNEEKIDDSYNFYGVSKNDF